MTNPPQDDGRDGRTGQQPAPGRRYGESGPPPEQQPYGRPSYGPPPGYGQQPPYGEPGDGEPGAFPGQHAHSPPPSGRKSKVGLIAAVTGVLVLLTVGGTVLAFQLRSTVLDPRSVERDVAAQFEQREGVAVDLNCADDMSVHSGASYECTGVTADDEPVTLRITITDEEQAVYTWTEP
jgi:hypothetical protein